MATIADKAILSGADNRPPMLENGLPPEVYALVRNHKVAKELWERIQLLMQRTSLTKQEKEFHHNAYSPPSSIPQIAYAATFNQQQQQPEFPSLDSGLTVLVFKQGDDPIDAINYMMSFLSAVVTSRYPNTNNQLRNSTTLQPVQGRQISFALGTNRTYTSRTSGSNSRKQRTVICYNYKREGHMSKQCTKPKRKRDDSWFKDKVLLVQAQAYGQILHEEELAFLADPGIAEVALMANLSHYGLDALAEVHYPDNVDTNLINQAVQAMPSSEQSNEAVQNSNSFAQQDALILSVIEQLKTQVVNCTKINLDNKSVNDTLTAELERYKEKVKVLKEGQHVTLKDPTPSNRPTKVEVPKELPKVSMVNTSLKKLKHHLAGFDVVFKERTTNTAITEGPWGFEHTQA
nr:hypothetical protein [Tanacetum cinerariifolium]